MMANESKKIFAQLTDALERIDRLEGIITRTEAERRQEREGYGKALAERDARIAVLEAENRRLRDIIEKNSGNSGKPPSSDGYKKIANSREKSGKPVGGQEGHKGHKPVLYDNPTEVIGHKGPCPHCGGEMVYGERYSAKQAIDIEVKIHIVEHRAYRGKCLCCGRESESGSPLNDIITYGDNLKAVAALLYENCVSFSRTKEMLSELTGGAIDISEGTLAKWAADLSAGISPAIDKIKDNLAVSAVLHKDETGIRVNGGLQWLHVLSNDRNTLYTGDRKRGNEADKAVDILPSYSGVLVHDHLKGLYDFSCKHAECNAHILRYLKWAVERHKRKWAQELIVLLVTANNAVKYAKERGAPFISGSETESFSNRYDKILDDGFKEFLDSEKQNYNGDDMKLLRRLRLYKREHLRFLYDFSVPFDNNLAERDLRMIKAKMKISGCFRGPSGPSVFAAIKSYTSTLRKNSLNVFSALKSAFAGNPLLSWG